MLGIPLVLHVVEERRRPLVNEHYLTAVVELANRCFRRSGFVLQPVERRALPPRFGETRGEEGLAALRRHCRPGALSAFVVETFWDDRRRRYLSGKYREMQRYSDRAVVLVARGRADALTLGHEVGHYLGLGHHDEPRNLMYPHDGPPRDRLDAAQRRQLRSELAHLRAAGNLELIDDPEAARPVELPDPQDVESGSPLLYQATETFSDGVVYAGEFLVDKPHGQGDVTFPDGARYAGELREGRRTGRGVIHYPDGGRYEGEVRVGQRHGRGQMRFADGRVRQGRWREDQPVGRARTATVAPTPPADEARPRSTATSHRAAVARAIADAAGIGRAAASRAARAALDVLSHRGVELGSDPSSAPARSTTTARLSPSKGARPKPASKRKTRTPGKKKEARVTAEERVKRRLVRSTKKGRPS